MVVRKCQSKAGAINSERVQMLKAHKNGLGNSERPSKAALL